MFTKEIALKKVQNFLTELRILGIKIDKAILFGSYSSGKQNQYSDIDLALVSDMFSGFGYEDRKLFSKINIKDEFIDIETKTYSSEYFEKGDPFIEEIKKTGINLIN